MVALLIAAAIAFVCQIIFALASLIPRQKMVDLVNARVPVEQRYRSAGAHPGNPGPWMSLGTKYKRLYPDGRLLWRSRVWMALSFVAFFAFLGCLYLYAYVGRK